MHKTSKDFMDKIKENFPDYFTNNKLVLDVGSQDINGNNKYLFDDCRYFGLDLGPGKNVDIITHVADFYPTENGKDIQFDTIISSNAFEHDKRYIESIRAITIRLLKQNGLFVFSAASLFREHGTTESAPDDSPYTNDYYKNLTEHDIREALYFDKYFEIYKFTIEESDLQFLGIKK